jgi:hypothetical protein
MIMKQQGCNIYSWVNLSERMILMHISACIVIVTKEDIMGLAFKFICGHSLWLSIQNIGLT